MRISHRDHSQKSHQAPQVQYVERIIEVPVDVPIDESSIKEWAEHRLDALNVDIMLVHHDHKEYTTQRFESIKTELEMQRRAFIAIKTQRDIDRDRRLMLIKRMKKEHDLHKQTALKLKLAVGASLIISAIAIFWH